MQMVLEHGVFLMHIGTYLPTPNRLSTYNNLILLRAKSNQRLLKRFCSPIYY